MCGKCGTALLDGKPVALDDARFERFVARNELPVVVDFWAAWCGPCRAMAPQFEQAARQLKGEAILAKVDSDASPQTSSRFAHPQHSDAGPLSQRQGDQAPGGRRAGGADRLLGPGGTSQPA